MGLGGSLTCVFINKLSFTNTKKKKIEIIPCILSDYNAIKLELNNKSKDKKKQTAGN
jgi:hypothetical protein